MIASMKVTEILRKYAAGVRDFSAANLAEMNLSEAYLSGADLTEADLSVANLSGANLSGTKLCRAKLNVARLRRANLCKANLTQAHLNAANLIEADLRRAKLFQTSLVRAELIKANLNGAFLKEADLSEADLREAMLKQALLSCANLSEAKLRGATLTAAILEEANLNGADLSRADLRSCNLREAELRKANLSCANLSGANLSGSNLRWADLSGANLAWADLSNAKLSGANLMGADLSNTHLLNASLVHADLTHARLIKANWIGADLTGAILTGAKLYAVSRFGLKTEGITCDWVDLSPDGDQSEIYNFSQEAPNSFFSDTLPKVRIIVDAPLDLKANSALISIYERLASALSNLSQAPSIEVGVRRTTLTFTGSNFELFTLAYLAILPFQDALATHRNLIALIKMLQSQEEENLELREQKGIKPMIKEVAKVMSKIENAQGFKTSLAQRASSEFFKASTQTIIINSSDQILNIYNHPAFGKYLIGESGLPETFYKKMMKVPEGNLPSVGKVISFIKAFD